MNRSAILCLVLLVATVSARQWFHDVKATSLTQELFDQMVGGENHVIIEYFTPWCGYCQQMAGEWNKLFTHYEENASSRKDVKVTKINCEDHQRLCHSQDVRQFPTIILYVAGSKNPSKSYQGWRRFDDFRDFIENNVPAYVPANLTEEQKQAFAQQQLDQKLREEEQKRKEQEEQIRIREEAIERQHREEILRLQREEEIRLKRVEEEKVRAEQQRLEEERRKKELEDKRKEILDNVNNNNNINQQQTQQNNNGVANEGATTSLINQVIQSTRNIQQQAQQIPEIQSNIHTLKVNLDYAVQKVNIVEDHLKNTKETISSLLIEIQRLSNEVRTLSAQKEGQQQHQQQQQQQQHQQTKTEQQNIQVNNSNNNIPQIKGFSIVNSLVFIAVGVCIGYIFFRFFSGGKSPSALLITHNEIGKSN